jgi:hypothetical protein
LAAAVTGMTADVLVIMVLGAFTVALAAVLVGVRSIDVIDGESTKSTQWMLVITLFAIGTCLFLLAPVFA